MARDWYQQKAKETEEILRSLASRSVRFTLLRLVVFGLTVAGVWMTSSMQAFIPVAIVITGLVFFFGSVALHAKVRKQQRFYKQVRKLLERELDPDAELTSSGEVYDDPLHPYTSDLDIFAEKGLFEWMDRTGTLEGQQELARMFRDACSQPQDIAAMQEAVRELAEDHDHRLRFTALGWLGRKEEDAPSRIPKGGFRKSFNTILIWGLPIIPITGTVLFSIDYFTTGPWLLTLLPTLMLAGMNLRRVNAFYGSVDRAVSGIKGKTEMLKMLEEKQYNSSVLNEIQLNTREGEEVASRILGKLEQRINQFELRNNLIMGLVLNIFFVWDLRAIMKVEEWFDDHGELPEKWTASFARLDALNTLAALHFHHPEMVFPERSEEVVFDGRDIGHPLIPKEDRVNNALTIGNSGEVIILTGANMAGKSTFLRTVGVCMVLGGMGAPVPATSLRFGKQVLFSSMRTSDSLAGSASYFYAELNRLKEVVDRLESGQELFVILDEILKGTNSHDKEQGSREFIQKISHLGASGIIATHDINLCTLNETEPQIRNCCFEVEFGENELIFDYKLRDGVCKNMNATWLMKKMKIT